MSAPTLTYTLSHYKFNDSTGEPYEETFESLPSGNVIKCSYINPYNKLKISFTPDMSLAYHEVRITPIDTAYGIGIGTRWNYKTGGLAGSTTHTYEYTDLVVNNTTMATDSLKKDCILKSGTVIKSGSTINAVNYTEDTTLEADLTILCESKLTVNSIIKSGSTMSVNSILEGTTYATVTTLTSDVTITKGEGIYRIGLYAKNQSDGLWDATYLLLSSENKLIAPTDYDAIEVLTDEPIPEA